MRYRRLTRREMTYFLLYMMVAAVGSVEVISLFGPELIYNGDVIISERVIPGCSDIVSNIGRGAFSWELVCLSDSLGNPRYLPFLFSLALIPATFLFVQAATKSDLAAILSAAGLIINPVYLIFNDSAAYHQFWAFFTIMSLYLAYRKPILAAPVLFLGILAKPAALMFVPVLAVLLYPHRRALLLLGLVASVVLLYTVLGGTILVHGYITPPDPSAPNDIFWSLTKHTTILLIIPIAISLVYWQHRLSLALLVSISSYIGAATFTTAAIFPYHTIPIFAILNGCIASLIITSLKRAKPISIIPAKS